MISITAWQILLDDFAPGDQGRSRDDGTFTVYGNSSPGLADNLAHHPLT